MIHANRQRKKVVTWTLYNRDNYNGKEVIAIINEDITDEQEALRAYANYRVCNGGDPFLEKVTRKYVAG